MKSIHFAVYIGVFFATSVFAEDLQLGEASYYGSACPQGSLSIAIHDIKKIDLKFRPIVAEAGEQAQKFIDKKECNITIPIHVPRHLSFSLPPVEYKGILDIPYGAQSKIFINYYYEYVYGTSQQNLWGSWQGEQTSTYLLFAPKKENYSPFWSACSTDAKLRLNFTLSAQTNDAYQPTMMSIHELNGFELQTKQCQ